MSYVLQFFIAAIATVTFAILFAAPKKELVFCGVSGGLAWLVYFILYRQSGNVVLGSLVATFVLTILSRILAVARCNPATIYLVSGIFPLVPGAGIYYTAYYLISGMPAKCSAKGLETLRFRHTNNASCSISPTKNAYSASGRCPPNMKVNAAQPIPHASNCTAFA